MDILRTRSRQLGLAAAAIRERYLRESVPYGAHGEPERTTYYGATTGRWPSKADPTTRGYNYGQPVDLPKPAGWDQWCAQADALRFANPFDSTRSWKLDMALRDVRHATTVEQWKLAVGHCFLLFGYAPLPEPTWPEDTGQRTGRVYRHPSKSALVDDYSFSAVAGIPKPAVAPTAENETDRQTREKNLFALLDAARATCDRWRRCSSILHTVDDLNNSLKPFANVNTRNHV